MLLKHLLIIAITITFFSPASGCPQLSVPIITGNTNICGYSTNTYTVANIPTATIYYWTLPNGWTGTSSTNSITVTVNDGAGILYVSASDGCSLSPIDSLQINVTTPHVSISANGPTTFCQGNDVKLDDTNPNQWFVSDYQWQLNNADITGQILHDLDVTASGTYRLILTDYNCSDTSNAISITVNPSPIATITDSGPTTFCIGDSVVFSAATAPGYTYQWQKYNTDIPGATNTSYTTSTDGIYTLITTLGPCKDTSFPPETVAVEANAPTALGGVYGPTTICEGSVNTYTTDYIPVADYYIWTLPAGWLGLVPWSSTAATASATSGAVTVFASNACGTTLPVSIYVTVTPNPNPTIVQNGNTLSTSTTFATYQWYYNNNLLPGATNQACNMIGWGTYFVVVTQDNCQWHSNTILGSPVNVGSANTPVSFAAIYPNPNDGVFTLSGAVNASDDKMDIQVTDLAGRVILKDVFALRGGIINKQVLLPNNLPAGMYILKATSQSGNLIIPFTKQ